MTLNKGLKFSLCLLGLFLGSTFLYATRTLTIPTPVLKVPLYNNGASVDGSSIAVCPDVYLDSDGGLIQTVRCRIVSGFISGDILAVTTANVAPNLSSTYIQSYDRATGILTITDPTPTSGEGAPTSTWQALLRTLTFFPVAGNLSQNNVREVKYDILEQGAAYLHSDGTYHFYDFVVKSSNGNGTYPWDSSLTDAASAANKYYGLSGYLATVTSTDENYFIHGQAPSATGWISGTDGGTTIDNWHWAAGPELNQGFPGTNVGPAYSSWASGEPNSYGVGTSVEPYTQMLATGLWNNLPNATGDSGGVYAVYGYFIEWGGMPDPGAVVTIKIQNRNAVRHGAGY